MNLQFNPKDLLNSAGAGWVWDITFTIILIGLTLSFVCEIFKIQKKGAPDFWGLVWKTAIILILYKFLPGTLEETVKYINGSLNSDSLDQKFYRAFTTLNTAINPSAAGDSLPEGCPVHQNITLMNVGIDNAFSYLCQHIQMVMSFMIIVAVWSVKEIIFSWAWPVLLSLNMIGMCSALIIPAFPNQGFASLGGFFKSLASVSLWPVVYSVGIFICHGPLEKVFVNINEIFKCPTAFVIDSNYISALSGMIFMLLLIGATPVVSRKIVCHEGVRSAAFTGISGLGNILAISGRGISGKAGSGSMFSGFGLQLIKSGNLMTKYATENRNITKYNNMNTENIETAFGMESFRRENLNAAKDLISGEKGKEKNEVK